MDYDLKILYPVKSLYESKKKAFLNTQCLGKSTPLYSEEICQESSQENNRKQKPLRGR